MRPNFSVQDASTLISESFGMTGKVQELVSYSDQNFLLETGDGDKFVLKIANSSEPLPILDFQQGALNFLEQHVPHLNCPVLIPLADGKTLGTIAGREGEHGVWMVRYQPGQFVSELSCHSWDLNYGLGEYLGNLDVALEAYTHEAMHRAIPWDLFQAEHINTRLSDIDDVSHRAIVGYFYDRFTNHVLPLRTKLPMSVIHNDANDNNILTEEIDGEPGICGIIDFGDMVYTCTICELAIAIAYMILGKDDIMGVSRAIASGYHAARPLSPEEIDVLFDLVCIRLCISVCMSAGERKKSPENEYLAVSEAPAWEALKRLRDINPGVATRHLHDALLN